MNWPDLFVLEWWLDTERLARIIRIVLLISIGLPVLMLVRAIIARMAKSSLTAQGIMLVQKALWYGGLLLILVTTLNEMGFNLNAVLGAAGVVGVAVGFASQTSLSNIISGIFLLSEKPFSVGDVINIGSVTGVVLSVDLLSVKLRTFDNKLVRIPNENLIKTELTNITHFPIRRLDITVGVAYKENIAQVMALLREIADKNPYCLDEPEPIVVFTGFGSSSLDILFGVWFAKADMLTLRNSIMIEIKERFDAAGIEIAFPHLSLYAGEATKPFPVRVVPETPAPPPVADPKPKS
jgi:small-conductance mechanosensitive channel